MFMVVVMHLFATGTEQLAQDEFGGVSYFLVWFVNTLCHVANIEFILISAYFLVLLPFRASRLLRLWWMLLFYTVGGLLLAVLFKGLRPGGADLFYAFFPLTGSAYWFITQYFILVAVSPLLNRLIRGMNRQQHRRAVLLLVLLFSAIPSVFFWSDAYFSDGSDIAFMTTVYLIGAYLRIYGLEIKRPGLKYLALALALTVSRVLLGTFARRFTGSFHGAGLLYHGGLAFLPMAVCLFCFFKNLTIPDGRCAKLISAASPCAIGVYLLHTNRFFPPLSELVRLGDCGNDALRMIPRVLFAAFVILLLGVTVEALRKQLERLCGGKRICAWIDRKTEALLRENEET